MRAALLGELRTLGVPRLVVTDADTFHQGGLWLEHRHEGIGLDKEYALGTLPLVSALWGATVRVASVDSSNGDAVPVWYVCRPGQRVATVQRERPTPDP